MRWTLSSKDELGTYGAYWGYEQIRHDPKEKNEDETPKTADKNWLRKWKIQPGADPCVKMMRRRSARSLTEPR